MNPSTQQLIQKQRNSICKFYKLVENMQGLQFFSNLSLTVTNTGHNHSIADSGKGSPDSQIIDEALYNGRPTATFTKKVCALTSTDQ